MIAADTSTWVAFLAGEPGDDTALLDQALHDRRVLMLPAVLAELLSNPDLPDDVSATLRELPLMEIESGFWERAGRLRSTVIARGRKARLGDALIAQSCLDRKIPLLTRDRDFRAFVEAAGLDIATGA